METPETMLPIGAWFHLFFVLRLIGKGGNSEVYAVLLKGKEYALKVPKRGILLNATQLKRFEREAVILVHIRHVNVIDVLDHGVHQGIPWIRMELLIGLDLREAMNRLGPTSVGLVAAWLIQAAYGVHQCHVFGFVHRDIKPENIFVTRDNVVKLLDWGVVKPERDMSTLQTNQVNPPPIGTAPYMAPEQACGREVTAASDVYALGMIQVEMLLGRHPLLARGERYDFWTMLQRQVHEPVVSLTTLGLPESYSGVASRALSKNPLDRHPNALAFANDLLDQSDAYLHLHPEEDLRPGEPLIAWLLDELKEPPSFGTGPMKGRRSGASRSLRLCAMRGPRPAPPHSYDTEPMFSPPVHEADPSQQPGEPLDAFSVGRFGTEVMPPEMRDPSSRRALETLCGVSYTEEPALDDEDSLETARTIRLVAPPHHLRMEPGHGGPRDRRRALRWQVSLLLVAAICAVAAAALHGRGSRPTRADPPKPEPPVSSASATAVPVTTGSPCLREEPPPAPSASAPAPPAPSASAVPPPPRPAKRVSQPKYKVAPMASALNERSDGVSFRNFFGGRNERAGAPHPMTGQRGSSGP